MDELVFFKYCWFLLVNSGDVGILVEVNFYVISCLDDGVVYVIEGVLKVDIVLYLLGKIFIGLLGVGLCYK